MIGLYFHRVAVPAFNVRGFQIFKSEPTYNYQLLKLTTKHRLPYHKIVVGAVIINLKTIRFLLLKIKRR
jgi:hypothetical protein